MVSRAQLPNSASALPRFATRGRPAVSAGPPRCLRPRAAAAHEPGHWMAAVIACGKRSVLSHTSAAALWRIGAQLGPFT